MTLLGWRQPAEPREAGVPEEVAGVLARALSSVARVTFPASFGGPAASNVWSPMDGDLVRVLTAKGIGGRIAAKLRGTPADLTVISTRRPETVTRLFDDAAFPWWLQGQVVLLSVADAPPPEIDEDSLLSLFGEDWTQQAASVVHLGVEGILRPGVDGDVAGMLTFADAFDQAALNALEKETRLAGFDWEVVREEEFELR
jgi:hypothetical protein